MKIAFGVTMGLTLLTGGLFLLKQKLGALFAACSGVTFIVSLLSLVSFICLYIYEMPSHHCPFCILQREYGYIGYPLYATLLLGGVTGLGVGVLIPFRSIPSLAVTLPGFQRRLALTSVISWLLFTLLALKPILFTSFRLE
jgi:ABC-type xylose transport system permease subunit